MAQEFPTYAYQDDTVIAFHGNTVIASGTDFTKVAETADEYFSELKRTKDKTAAEAKRKTATHITTPGGETGTILGRSSSVFSENITVRFDNGQIRHYDTFVGDGLEYSTHEANAPKTPIEYFKRQLDETAEPGRSGLAARLNTLDDIRRGASRLASAGVSHTDGTQLHEIVLTAEAERREVQEALEYLAAADSEAMVPPTRQYVAVEQADLGYSDSWLDVVASEMIAESEAQDFDKLLEEGPTAFVASLESGALGNAGVIGDMAAEHIHSKTAGFQGEAVEEYRAQFVAATELARRQELRYRKDESHKEAAVHEASIADVPDEALFL